jgi:hypothetical protein
MLDFFPPNYFDLEVETASYCDTCGSTGYCHKMQTFESGSMMNNLFIIFSGLAAQRGLWPPHITKFLHHTQRRASVGRSPLDE